MAFRDEMSPSEQWAEDHGYYRWKCRVCGISGFTDTRPECACVPEPEEVKDADDAGDEE